MRLAAVAAAMVLGTAGSAPAQTPDAAAPAEANLAIGKAFLDRNAEREGVVSLPSGVQYRVVRSGPKDGANPTPSDDVTIHYEGRLLSGAVFDSSYARNAKATFPLANLIPGWIDAVQKMKPGDEWILYIPPSRAYGSRDRGPIPANSTLVFRIELFEVHKAEGDDGFEFH